ncbi:aminotransferase class V-fold PLP-dependent enzyme [Actinophytocola algeriensis]|uniref:Selenocysteine lyase/cysteine desulfurase n=1 Tax=Actinophytocola algeriensis TaxID=1768010 RepID=A0A7W7QBX5_9PSEU|nr:aminotransferase class V-fold PLP-dependent enzyme [Actinophytocola algeriensis]MBB4910316.1 selenocysteine lyase/cysteine desulfurase [Actinophytocola algeriensis]MBE1480695.1 selenocysteine lyase/cysteine desulfurase [Actinophytocola algeriensis]
MTLAIPHARAAVEGPNTNLPSVAGSRLTVPLTDGTQVQYANLDHAASAPCLNAVQQAVDEFLPWYASVHRGAGFASQVSTKIYERARQVVREFVGARRTDEVVFTRNTTDALNLLARALPANTSVVVFDTDHHAALLPWRGPHVYRVTPTAEVERDLDEALARTPTGPRLVVVTGATNVTGELWPVTRLAAVARRHGARIALDAAQLAPHRPVDVRELDVDYVVLSGHKLYAPFGAGALVGRPDWLRAANPYLAGGGATRLVTERAVSWNYGPERHEAGSPNVVGAYALAVACQTLGRSWDAVVAHEEELLARLRTGLASIPGVRQLSILGADTPRVGVVSFTVEGHDPGLVAAYLSAEHGIGVRDGAFCAHIAVNRLTEGRALRASLGLGSTAEHVDRLLTALRRLVTDGPAGHYELVDGRYAPGEDTRPLPAFLSDL